MCLQHAPGAIYIPGIPGVLGEGQGCVSPTCSRCYIYIPGIPEMEFKEFEPRFKSAKPGLN